MVAAALTAGFALTGLLTAPIAGGVAMGAFTPAVLNTVRQWHRRRPVNGEAITDDHVKGPGE